MNQSQPKKKAPPRPDESQIPAATSSQSGTRAAIRGENEAMNRAVDEERAKIHAAAEEDDAKFGSIDDRLRRYMEGIDENEEPTLVRRNVIELKRKLGVPPSSSQR